MTNQTDVATAKGPTEAIAEPTDEELRVRWMTSRIGIQKRLDAIGDEIRETFDALAPARARAILADDDTEATAAVAGLIGRQRALEAEQAELLERFTVASAEENRLQQLVSQALVLAIAASFPVKAYEHLEAATAADAQILELVTGLRDALVKRYEIDEARRVLSAELERSHDEHIRIGFDFPTTFLPEHRPFDPRALPEDPRQRYVILI
jgi:hypothetical protein